MTVINYVPPEPMFADTLLAFKAFAAPQMSVHISPDPLGPVNKILTLMAGNRRIKSVLWPVGVGAKVQVGHNAGMGGYFSPYSGPGWRALNGYSDPEPEPYRPPSWYVTVDGHRVIDVPDHEMRPPISPMSRIPLRTRIKQAATREARKLASRIAKPFGYHHEDDCNGSDW